MQDNVHFDQTLFSVPNRKRSIQHGKSQAKGRYRQPSLQPIRDDEEFDEFEAPLVFSKPPTARSRAMSIEVANRMTLFASSVGSILDKSAGKAVTRAKMRMSIICVSNDNEDSTSSMSAHSSSRVNKANRDILEVLQLYYERKNTLIEFATLKSFRTKCDWRRRT